MEILDEMTRPQRDKEDNNEELKRTWESDDFDCSTKGFVLAGDLGFTLWTGHLQN